MREASLAFLKDLINAPSPSGFEQPAAKVWRNYVQPFSDNVDHDLHGNSLAELNGTGSPRIMFSGHCDELGFIIKYVSEKGFLYFGTIGGHDRSIISGRRVTIYSEKGQVAGVTGKKAIHMMTPEERRKGPEVDSIWIDIGVSSKEEALERISIGDVVVYDTGFNILNGDIATSRAFDDKAGAFAVAEALRLLNAENLEACITSVATVQEEIGLRGARTATFGVDPVIGVAVDVTHATDHPDVSQKKEGEILLGSGPVILRGANANPHVSRLLQKAAEEEEIPFQVEGEPGGTGTDANAMQITRAGVAACLVSIPLRYMHTPSEVISLQDIENTARLLAAFAKRVKKDMDFRP